MAVEVEAFQRWGELVHHLASDNDAEELKRLIDSSPDVVHAREEHGWTPLHRAAVFGNTEAVALLLASGADPAARDLHRGTPLHDAATGDEKHLATMRLLVGAGAPIEARNTQWESPLHIAAQYSNLVGFAFLLGCGARTDWKDRRGLNAMRIAMDTAGSIPQGRSYAQQRREARSIVVTLGELEEQLARVDDGETIRVTLGP